MSYPPPLYDGAGEASAWVRRTEEPAALTYRNGGTVDYLARGDATGGLFGLYRWNFSGPRSGPDAHFHKTISESFYVLTGTVKFYDGTVWVDGRPGDFVHVPPGGIPGSATSRASRRRCCCTSPRGPRASPTSRP